MIKIFTIKLLKAILNFFFRINLWLRFFVTYYNDMKRYIKYSRTLKNDNEVKLLSTIIQHYHVIEKGLTMPETKLGFGKERIKSLSNSCILFIKNYDKNNIQLRHAISVLIEYEDFHNSNNHILDDSVLEAINKVKYNNQVKIKKSTQKQISKVEYFKYSKSSFDQFSTSRASVRNFTGEEVSTNLIYEAIKIAHNAPSACNRQSWRTYVYEDRDKINLILESQGGNRGFGHLTNKLIVISGELGAFCNTNERYQVYIDGGIFSMNLLYSLHNKEIAACIMNCSFDYDKEVLIKNFCNIRESEVLIAMIACGIPPSIFSLALSPRSNPIINQFR